MPTFFGKYRGKVAANRDPLNLGRIQVAVPAVYGDEQLAWAMPCTPYAGTDIGFFAIPPVNSNIWVEFEQGDPDYPIWSGCFWGENELPQAAIVPNPQEVQVFRVNGITLTWSNFGTTKGVTLEVDSPVVTRKLKLVCNSQGIEINNNEETITKLTATAIEIKNKTNASITVNADNIEVKQGSVTTKWTASAIELTCSPAALKLTSASGIELTNTPATAKLSSSGIELGSTPAVVKIAPSGVELNGGAAASIKISPVSVNVNNGALEVI
ncbi:MAG: phage baseplate assembly protein V [Synechococcales bacterium]|nr:phage baseplate assembly protein V [Synechococcales bacterium]